MIRIINGVTVTEGSGNPYADMGLPDAEEMLAKAMLTSQLDDTLHRIGMTQAQAAKALHVPTAWLTELLLGKFGDISRDEINHCLERLNSIK